jgi:hypothetical protein
MRVGNGRLVQVGRVLLMPMVTLCRRVGLVGRRVLAMPLMAVRVIYLST